jgi:hypothetical protein
MNFLSALKVIAAWLLANWSGVSGVLMTILSAITKWETAKAIANDRLLGEANRRAMGYKIPVHLRNGEIIHRHCHSDILLMFLIKGQNPAFKEGQNVAIASASASANALRDYLNAPEDDGYSPFTQLGDEAQES